MNTITNRMTLIAPIVLRIGVSLVFLWFGSQQLLHPSSWVGFIPGYAVSLSHLSAITLVNFNGAFEIVFGFCLISGYFTRVTALLLAIHMFDIAFTVGYGAIGARDLCISIATLSVFLYGADVWSLDTYFKTRNTLVVSSHIA